MLQLADLPDDALDMCGMTMSPCAAASSSLCQSARRVRRAHAARWWRDEDAPTDAQVAQLLFYRPSTMTWRLVRAIQLETVRRSLPALTPVMEGQTMKFQTPSMLDSARARVICAWIEAGLDAPTPKAMPRHGFDPRTMQYFVPGMLNLI